MCGIAGRVWGPTSKVEPEQIQAMCRQLAHRGPDGRGVRLEGRCGLGHTRLSIIDLAGGAQPLSGCTEKVWVTFNGEIYNHRLLRAELEGLGHRFRTRSDTEVLTHGWEEWGGKLPEKLRGMFAFALWDGRTQTLFAARDRLGIKPFYYAQPGADLVFASEVKALLVLPDLAADLDEQRLAAFMALRFTPGPATLFRGIAKLQPGHWLRYESGHLETRPYWDVPTRQRVDPGLCEAEHVERFAQLFEESVRLRLMAEVPVGVFLSGGLDSSAVAWAMRRHSDSPVKSFSIGYQGDPSNELEWARLAANALHTEHREVQLTSALFREALPRVAWHLDEPVGDAACVPLFYVSELASKEVVVVLSGEGADEALAGYPLYRKQLIMEGLRRGGRLVDLVAPLIASRTRHPKLQKYLNLLARPLERRHLSISRAFSESLIGALLRGGSGGESAEQVMAPHHQAVSDRSPLQRMLYVDTKAWLPDDLLLKADRMSMAHAIELRVPFLDHELLAACWSLPDDLRLKGKVGKYVLRRAMAAKLPAPILSRKKMGFAVPTSRWLRQELHEPCRAALLASGSATRTYFQTETVKRLLDEHRTGRADRTEELYTLWIFEEWHRQLLGASGRSEAQDHPEATGPARSDPTSSGRATA